ncbi:SPOR domain-containing protein [Maribius pontilimi]|uniref:SPOR domain-containing protein n=1 Tax=Palleronia pontilimi TaxID=1964209 RepID=A0A934MF48_9RHOB|nr:SPOR domain-containing protein [Palleronia pontilimi]MBJ3761134.1 SPOR domain-containing protein [Palleronia pontilimi]
MAPSTPRPRWPRMTVAAAALLGLSACVGDDGARSSGDASRASSSNTTRLVERDVEAPEVFQVTEPGLWDGRPSLGGVWVAHPDTKDPERVIIRNEANGKFVIGALFRRERENPGPRLQVSSDAAEALGLLAGAPETLNVTALRREEVADDPVPALTISDEMPTNDAGVEPSGEVPIEAETLSAPETIAASSIDAPVSAAPAAIERAEAAAAPPVSSLSEPYIQIGIFSVEQNAENTAQSLRGVGVVPTVKSQTTKGKTFYRVIVGPAATSGDRAAVLRKVKTLGFADAYAVSG